MITAAPAWARASTMARPRPRLPPVTRATLPLRSKRPDGSAMRSAAELLGELHEVARDHVERLPRLGLGSGPTGAELERARHIGGAAAAGGRRWQVGPVGG